MKTQKLQTRFARETRFAIRPVPAAVPFRAAQETQLERLKARLLQRLLDNAIDPELNAPLRRAANEAAALAWTTPYPLLVLPTLLEEKACVAQRQVQKQTEIRLRTQQLFAEAA